jgi:hypothetical protein
MMRFATLLLTLLAVGQAFTVVGPMARMVRAEEVVIWGIFCD